MNERIKEIAEQAGIVFWEMSGDVDWRQANKETLEKFARLIIKQCIKAASDLGDGLIKDNTWHDGVRACIWSMQDEFGLDRNFGIE